MAGFSRVDGVELYGFDDFRNTLEGAKADAAEAEGNAWWVGTNVQYGLFLEFGTENMLPRPWLRPALDAAARGYFRDLFDLLGDFDTEGLTDAPKTTAFKVERIAKKSMEKQGPSSPLTPPAVDTGVLKASIAAQPSQNAMVQKSESRARRRGWEGNQPESG